MAEKVIYTGLFVDDNSELLRQHPPKLQGEGVSVFAHHVTKEFRPKDGLAGVEVGRQRTLLAIGYVATPELHTILVRDPDDEPLSVDGPPHITIATAEGVNPAESKRVIAEAQQTGTVVPIEPPIEVPTTEGYFNGKNIITNN